MRLLSIKDLRQFAQDHTPKEIIKEFNLPNTTFYRIVKQFNIEYIHVKTNKKAPPKPHGLEIKIINDYKESYPTQKELSKKYGVAETTVNRILRKYKVNISRSVINRNRIKDYKANHKCTTKEICKALKLSKNCVEQHLHAIRVENV